MNRKTKDRLYKFTFFMSGLLFFFGGIEMFSEHKPLLGVIQFFAGICNLLIVFIFRKQKTKIILDYSILILNLIAASAMSIYYFSTGKNNIQYAFILIAVLYAIAILTYRRKNR